MWRRFFENKLGLVAGVSSCSCPGDDRRILPLLAPYDPYDQDLANYAGGATLEEHLAGYRPVRTWIVLSRLI